jgi:hypothetical protein
LTFHSACPRKKYCLKFGKKQNLKGKNVSYSAFVSHLSGCVLTVETYKLRSGLDPNNSVLKKIYRAAVKRSQQGKTDNILLSFHCLIHHKVDLSLSLLIIIIHRSCRLPQFKSIFNVVRMFDQQRKYICFCF